MDMPDTVVSPGSDADLAPAEAVEAEPTQLERRERLRTVFLGGLLGLAALAASYAAAEIVLPILLAFVLNLVFRPVLRLLLRARLPQPLAALIIVLSLVALFIMVAVLLSGPVSSWIGRVPETLPRIEPGLLQFFKPGSPDTYERLLATFQTYRHRAVVTIQAPGLRGTMAGLPCSRRAR